MRQIERRRAVAGGEAALPTPCLDRSPCPVVVSVSSVAEEAGPLQTGNWTAGRLAMGASRHPNPPDRRSPIQRGGEHGNRTTNPSHDPREKVSRVSSTGQGCATPDGALQVGGTMGDTVNDAARRSAAGGEAALLTPCRVEFPCPVVAPLSFARGLTVSQPTGPALSSSTRWRA